MHVHFFFTLQAVSSLQNTSHKLDLSMTEEESLRQDICHVTNQLELSEKSRLFSESTNANLLVKIRKQGMRYHLLKEKLRGYETVLQNSR